MTVARMWFDNKIVKPDGFENYSGSSFDNNAPGWQSLKRIEILCNKAKFKPVRILLLS